MKFKIDDVEQTITLLETVTPRELRRYIKRTFVNWKEIMDYRIVVEEQIYPFAPFYPVTPTYPNPWSQPGIIYTGDSNIVQC